MKNTRIDTSASNDAVIVEYITRADSEWVCMEVMSESLAVSVSKGVESVTFFADLDDAEYMLNVMLAAVQAKRRQLGV